MIVNHFVEYHHHMQETRNKYFGSKKRTTTFCQAKTDKHECRNVTATYVMQDLKKYLFAETSIQNVKLSASGPRL